MIAGGERYGDIMARSRQKSERCRGRGRDSDLPEAREEKKVTRWQRERRPWLVGIGRVKGDGGCGWADDAEIGSCVHAGGDGEQLGGGCVAFRRCMGVPEKEDGRLVSHRR